MIEVRSEEDDDVVTWVRDNGAGGRKGSRTRGIFFTPPAAEGAIMTNLEPILLIGGNPSEVELTLASSREMRDPGIFRAVPGRSTQRP